MSRKALGRGLSALIADEAEAEPKAKNKAEKSFLELDVELIQPNSEQPRTSFPETELDELAQSIRSNGIVQPIVVRRKGKQYQIVAGERRWRAAQKAELDKVPVVVRDVTDEKLLELALIENIQRQELNPIEEANAYKRLIENLGVTQEKVAEQVGKTRTFITNYLRLLKLPAKIVGFVETGKLSVGHARALLSIEDSKAQMQFAKDIIASSWSVRKTESAVRKHLKGDSKSVDKPKEPTGKDANVKRAETKLRRLYATQVKIDPGGKGQTGKIELEYYGEADLDRIYKLLMRK